MRSILLFICSFCILSCFGEKENKREKVESISNRKALELNVANKRKIKSALKTFSILSQDKKNFIYSPLSLDGALLLLAQTSKDKMLQVVSDYLEVSGDESLTELQSIHRHLTDISGEVESDFASALVFSDDVKLNKDKIAQLPGSEVFRYNFQKDASKAIEEINAWIAKKTRDKVKDLISNLSTDTKMILVNALYLKAPWEEKLNKSLGKFKVNGTDNTELDMVGAVQYTKYFEGESFRALSPNLEGADVDLWIVLPKKTIQEMNPTFSIESINNILDKSKPIRASFKIPEFKLRNKIKLEGEFRAMGLGHLLKGSPNYEYSGFFKKDVDLILSAVTQGNFFALNEYGIEAASSTVLEMVAGGMPAKPIQFTVDRPFLFLVYNNKLGRIMFMGQVYDPRES